MALPFSQLLLERDRVNGCLQYAPAPLAKICRLIGLDPGARIAGEGSNAGNHRKGAMRGVLRIDTENGDAEALVSASSTRGMRRTKI